MSKFGEKSSENLIQVHTYLQRVAYSVVQVFDHSIICGHRNEKEQTKAYDSKHSKTQWPNSKHNSVPSMALDFLPYPFDGYPSLDDGIEAYTKKTAQYYAISAAYIAIGHEMGIDLRGGFDWDGDGIFTDQSFDDIGHIEIIGYK